MNTDLTHTTIPPMKASLFLTINAVIVFILVFRIILRGLSREKPTLKKSEEGVRMEFFDIFTGAKPREKNLTCPFVFLGINYDAYEVLGVPAGAPKEIWQAAYRDLSRNADSTLKNVLNAAVKALES